ncbi:MAG: 3-oxoacyl-[acyl-carrier-protein] reductase [Sedimentisphaerales bacterium]|jgi:3-oxoacyl-[acyl-carrier protein] reductase
MSEKRLAVVTGAARGIGRAIVLELLKQGRIVAGLDLNAVQLEELVAVCKQHGYEVITKCIDITNSEKLTEVLEELANQFGGIGILVNNAGITRDKLMIQMDDEDFDKVINVNLRAAFVATRVAARSMIRNKFGRIVSISSVAGVIGQAGSTNYAASKAGLIGMTKSIAREVGKKNVTANCIAPGFIQTDMTAVLPDAVKEGAMAFIPVKRFGTVDDVARAVAFLASDDSGYITGQVLGVDGGMAM